MPRLGDTVDFANNLTPQNIFTFSSLYFHLIVFRFTRWALEFCHWCRYEPHSNEYAKTSFEQMMRFIVPKSVPGPNSRKHEFKTTSQWQSKVSYPRPWYIKTGWQWALCINFVPRVLLIVSPKTCPRTFCTQNSKFRRIKFMKSLVQKWRISDTDVFWRSSLWPIWFSVTYIAL